MKLSKKKKTIAMIFFVAVLFGFFATLLPNVIICASSNKYIYDLDEVGEIDGSFDCILVLGAGVFSDGTPTPMLEDRLRTAIEVYNNGLAGRILMSGDHISDDYDEVGAMKRFATENGVDENIIFLDHAGISTYDSIYRAIKVFGAEKILIVTQKYHLYRAVYIAHSMGVDAYGISSNLRDYRKQPLYSTREVVARVKDFVYSVFKPEAIYMDDEIDLLGDGRVTH